MQIRCRSTKRAADVAATSGGEEAAGPHAEVHSPSEIPVNDFHKGFESDYVSAEPRRTNGNMPRENTSHEDEMVQFASATGPQMSRMGSQVGDDSRFWASTGTLIDNSPTLPVPSKIARVVRIGRVNANNLEELTVAQQAASEISPEVLAQVIATMRQNSQKRRVGPVQTSGDDTTQRKTTHQRRRARGGFARSRNGSRGGGRPARVNVSRRNEN